MALGLSSCATDDSVEPFHKSSTDSTIVSFTFLINDGVRTRAINTANENTVSDITVLSSTIPILLSAVSMWHPLQRVPLT